MIAAQNIKVADAVCDSVNAASLGTGIVDTVGYDYATVIVVAGEGPTSAALTALKVQEGDASNLSDAADLVSFTDADVDGTTNALADFDNDESVIFEIDLKARKRYIKVVATAGATATELSSVVILSRAGEAATDTTAGGADFRIRA
jgi:hypothetical protein